MRTDNTCLVLVCRSAGRWCHSAFGSTGTWLKTGIRSNSERLPPYRFDCSFLDFPNKRLLRPTAGGVCKVSYAATILVALESCLSTLDSPGPDLPNPEIAHAQRPTSLMLYLYRKDKLFLDVYNFERPLAVV